MVELEPIPEEDDLMESEGHQSGDIEHHGRVHLSSDMTNQIFMNKEKLNKLNYFP